MLKMNKKTVLIIAVITFAVIAGGLSAFFYTRDNGVAAVVNGVKISTDKVAGEMTKAVAQYEAQGMILQPEQLVEVRKNVIDNLIIREVLLQESESYETSAEELETQISTYRDRFDTEEAFTQILNDQGLTLESFRKVVGDDLKIQKMIEDRVPEETEITDEEVLTFYNENPAYFTEKEKIHASHILVSLEDKETDEEKSLAYKKIESIGNKLKDGADFAELARQESEGPSGPDGGDLGQFSRGQMVSAFETVAFALPEGKISGIVETQFGYHIIKLHKRYPATSVPLENVEESIKSYLVQEKNQNKMNEFLDSLKADAKIRIPDSAAPEEA